MKKKGAKRKIIDIENASLSLFRDKLRYDTTKNDYDDDDDDHHHHQGMWTAQIPLFLFHSPLLLVMSLSKISRWQLVSAQG